MKIICVFPSHEKAYMKEIIKEGSESLCESAKDFDINYLNSEKVLNEGYEIPCKKDDIKNIITENITVDSLKNDIDNFFINF